MPVPKIDVVSVVATLLPDFGIGCQGGLPWRLSKEMKYFRQVTSSTFDSNKQNAVIMGRKTWESIPLKFRPLPNRINVVISRGFDSQLTLDTLTEEKQYYKINSLTSGIDQLKEQLGEKLERIYIIGGGQIYSEGIKISDKLLITKLEIDSPELDILDMDTFLNVKQIQDDFVESKNGLRDFLPSKVELPEPFTQGEYVEYEKGYKCQYTLYTKTH